MSELPHALALASLLVSSRSGRGIGIGGSGSGGGGSDSDSAARSPSLLQRASNLSLALSSTALGALPTFYCAVCMERHTEAEGFTLSAGCSHKFCRECMRMHVTAKLRGPRMRLQCMSPGVPC